MLHMVKIGRGKCNMPPISLPSEAATVGLAVRKCCWDVGECRRRIESLVSHLPADALLRLVLSSFHLRWPTRALRHWHSRGASACRSALSYSYGLRLLGSAGRACCGPPNPTSTHAPSVSRNISLNEPCTLQVQRWCISDSREG